MISLALFLFLLAMLLRKGVSQPHHHLVLNALDDLGLRSALHFLQTIDALPSQRLDSVILWAHKRSLAALPKADLDAALARCSQRVRLFTSSPLPDRTRIPPAGRPPRAPEMVSHLLESLMHEARRVANASSHANANASAAASASASAAGASASAAAGSPAANVATASAAGDSSNKNTSSSSSSSHTLLSLAFLGTLKLAPSRRFLSLFDDTHSSTHTDTHSSTHSSTHTPEAVTLLPKTRALSSMSDWRDLIVVRLRVYTYSTTATTTGTTGTDCYY